MSDTTGDLDDDTQAVTGGDSDRERELDREMSTGVTGSPVVRSVSRIVTPFVIVFGSYLTLFGTSLPGGAFQGGVVMATVIVLIALAFGFDATREWIDARAFGGLFLLGAGIFAVVSFGALAYGGAVLEIAVFPLSVENMVKIVEVAIASLVAGVIIGLYLWIHDGIQNGSTDK